jgi:tRNA nucleotidyltransferase (CCA-adding enzyme)
MSDYMFMLENHLTSDQARVLNAVQSAASEANVGLFLTGGAMRDMLGGFAIRDLDFTVEGPALKLAKEVAKRAGGQVVSVDELRGSAELVFPGGVTCEIAMARKEKYASPGSRPQISPGTIHEDLLCRDFTINAIALSLNRASRGLLIDPTNGLGDLLRREMRTPGNYTLYDDPSRILRLIRLKTRLGFTVDERTQSQYRNAREAGMESRIPARALARELRQMAEEPNPGEVVRALADEGLLELYSPALTGSKLNLAGLARLAKARQCVPFGVDLHAENLGLFLYFLTEKLTPKEKAAFIKAAALKRSEVENWQTIESRARKLETALKSAKLHKPSQLYAAASQAPGELLLFLLARSEQRLVQDRIKNYLQKYLPAALEISDEAVAQKTGLEPGTPKFLKAKAELIAARLDARPKKAPEAAEPAASATGPSGKR